MLRAFNLYEIRQNKQEIFYTHVVADVDGVIVATDPDRYKAMNAVLASFDEPMLYVVDCEISDATELAAYVSHAVSRFDIYRVRKTTVAQGLPQRIDKVMDREFAATAFVFPFDDPTLAAA